MIAMQVWRATQNSTGRAVATHKGGKERDPCFWVSEASLPPESRGHDLEAAVHSAKSEANHRREHVKKTKFHLCGQHLLNWFCLFPLLPKQSSQHYH